MQPQISPLSILIFLNLLALAACAEPRASYHHKMQFDGSYEVEINGNGDAECRHSKAAAHERAKQLCPKGYKVESGFCDGEPYANYFLTVHCEKE